MMVLLQQGFAVSKKAKIFEIIGTRVFLLGFLKYFRNILKTAPDLELLAVKNAKIISLFRSKLLVLVL